MCCECSSLCSASSSSGLLVDVVKTLTPEPRCTTQELACSLGTHLYKAGISVESVLKVVYQPQVCGLVSVSFFGMDSVHKVLPAPRGSHTLLHQPVPPSKTCRDTVLSEGAALLLLLIYSGS